MWKIVALLDTPSPKSFGMLSFIVSDSEGHCVLANGAMTRPIRHTDMSARDLVNGGHAVDVSSFNITVAECPVRAAAGWIGQVFMEQVRNATAPTPDLPAKRYRIEGAGEFWIGASGDVYRRLSDWIDRAAFRVFREKNRALADMMVWTLPDRIETQAARWYTRESVQEQAKLLALDVRIYHGRRDNMYEDQLKQAFEDVVKRFTE